MERNKDDAQRDIDQASALLVATINEHTQMAMTYSDAEYMDEWLAFLKSTQAYIDKRCIPWSPSQEDMGVVPRVTKSSIMGLVERHFTKEIAKAHKDRP